MTATYRTARFRLADEPSVAVVNLGLACCALEVESAVHLGLLEREAGHPAAERTVVLVAGTVTGALAPATAAAVAAEAQAVILSVGACATSGGPYWDAPSVLPGVDSVVSVATYVPGCPPRPEAIVEAIREAAHG